MTRAISRFKIVYTITFLCLVSCTEIMEKDISLKEIVFITPGENCVTTYSSQIFLWEEVEGAMVYDLQIVTPSFNAAELLLADTVLTKARFEINLFPGKFEWRVRARNGSSASNYYLKTLQVDSTRNLDGQLVKLTNPSKDSYVNSGTVTLKWDKLYNAESYIVKVYKNEWVNDPVYSSEPLDSASILIKDLQEGKYSWGVKAVNSFSSTDFSKGNFLVDKTVPGTPVLTKPEDKSLIYDKDIAFSWSDNQDAGSPLKDSILVSSDSLFRSGATYLKLVQGKSPFNLMVQDTGTYFWKVKSTDLAGNQGQFSQIFRFTRK